MKKLVALFSAVALLSSVAALAGPGDGKKPAKPTKVTDVWTCPIQGAAIKDHSHPEKGAAVVGNYRVHFCCAGCPEEFAKLSKADQLKKAKEAAAKDAPSKPAKKS
jgi:hypothetical protein